MIDAVGQYKILEAAGDGPLGELFRARDTRVGRTVTVTVVADHIADDPLRREQFLRDARAAAAISHPNIVTLYEAGEHDGRVYLAHEYVQGHSLATLIGGRPLNPRRAIDLAGQIAEALADAHASGLIHGALTADAIVVTPKGHVKITDFGMAAFDGRVAARNAASRAAQAARSPERADLVALGVILFEMLTGAAPSPGAAVPSVVNRSLPREIDPLVTKSLGIGGGYEAAATLAAELRALGAVFDVRQDAYDAASIARLGPASKGRRIGWIAVALALAALAAWWYVSA